MSYRLAFDAGKATPDLTFTVMGLVFVAVGFVLWRRERFTPMSTPKPSRFRLFGRYYFWFAVAWTTLVTGVTLVAYLRGVWALRDGSAKVVEGVVENFHPMPFTGHDTERFTVGGVKFSYSDYELTNGFNKTSSHGGPMHEGLKVRIHYMGTGDDATILRLEIAQ